MSSVADRQDAIETCTRMAWYADMREWEKLTELFADEVRLDYTSQHGGEPLTLSGKEVVDAWSGVLSAFTTTQHLLGSFLADVDGDTAVVTAMFQATHSMPSNSGGSLWTLSGRYRIGLARTRTGWEINEVVMTILWADGNQQLYTRAAEIAAGG
ncbi:nuclear transport factor 2 family protein [Streptomyces sp. NPDC093094]|uniref:nuclear transport factor 2 family protein n=1 Tax=Streptomyces sp. NPDC093094 TaxID=3366026 RepID=UPI00380B3E50